MKKTLSILLAFIMLFSVVPVSGLLKNTDLLSVKADAANESDLSFELNEDDNTYYVSGCYEEAEGELLIPSEHYGNPVTGIAEYAFYGCSGLTSVTIPGSISYIGEFAFYGCTGLKSINVSENNKNYSSFEGVVFNKNKTELICCPGGKETRFIIPDSVTDIADCAFFGCVALSEIFVSEGNKNFVSTDGILFNYDETELICCPAGKTGNFVMPGTVKTIHGFAFAMCMGITEITFSDNVTSIGDGAFMACVSLESVTVPDSVKNVGANIFFCCSNLSTVKVGSGITDITSGFCSACTALTSVIIGDNVIGIAKGAFEDCGNFIIYCLPDSFAQKYAAENNIKYAFSCIAKTENSVIDYDNKLIFTKLQYITDMAQIVTVPPTMSVEQTEVYETDDIRLYSTGSMFWIYENGINTDVYTLIVEGDLNSDGVCDVCDAVLTEEALNGIYPFNETQVYAANGAVSDEITLSSYQNVVNAALA